MRNEVLRAIVVLAVCGWPLTAQAPPNLIENDQVLVRVITHQPHVKVFGRHEHPGVMIYLQAGRQRIQEFQTRESEEHPDEPSISSWKAGDVKWSSFQGMALSEILSDAPVTIIEVEPKKAGDPAKKLRTPSDPLKLDPRDYKLAFENNQVRVTRVKIGPHHSVPEHEHVLNRVVIYLTDQNAQISTPDGKIETARHKAGEVSWAMPTRHKEENLSDRLFEAIVVELKS